MIESLGVLDSEGERRTRKRRWPSGLQKCLGYLRQNDKAQTAFHQHSPQSQAKEAGHHKDQAETGYQAENAELEIVAVLCELIPTINRFERSPSKMNEEQQQKGDLD